MRSGKFNSLKVIFGTLILAGPLLAQEQKYDLGSPASEELIRDWDTDVLPDGTGLPAGSGTSVEGATVFRQNCSVCHGLTGREVTELALTKYPKGNPAPLVRLKGEEPSGYYIKTIGNFWPYATTVWDYINRAMPAFRWGLGSEESLTADQVYAVTAYLLHENGIIDAEAVMNASSLPRVEMPNRHGFIPSNPGDWRPGMRIDAHVSPRSENRATVR